MATRKQTTKKIETINPNTNQAKSSSASNRSTETAKAAFQPFVISGAKVLKQINKNLALVERLIPIPGTELKIIVRLYVCRLDLGVSTDTETMMIKCHETPSRKDAVAWIKENRPARVKKGLIKKSKVASQRIALLGAYKSANKASMQIARALKATTDNGQYALAIKIADELASVQKAINELYQSVAAIAQ